MSNHKSALKSHKQSLKRKMRNNSILSQINTFTKKMIRCVKANKKINAIAAFNKAQSVISKAAAKKVIKPNRASNKVSKLNVFLKKIIN